MPLCVGEGRPEEQGDQGRWGEERARDEEGRATGGIGMRSQVLVFVCCWRCEACSKTHRTGQGHLRPEDALRGARGGLRQEGDAAH